MLVLTDEDALEQLSVRKTPESLTLEFKASAKVKNVEGNKRDICASVSAMANAAGGQLILGMTEDGHVAAGLDDGIPPNPCDRLWLEQIVQQNIRPKIEGFVVHPIALKTGNFAYVLDIPQSKTVHQSMDRRYYRRRNFRNDIMEDYEIREAMSRDSKPDLRVSFLFDKSLDHANLKPARDSDDNMPVGLTPLVENLSNEPALYAVVTVAVDENYQVLATDYENAGRMKINGVVLRAYRVRFNPSQRLPIFKEMPTALPNLGIVVPATRTYNTNPHMIAYEVRSPGCFRTAVGSLSVEGGSLIRVSMGEALTTPLTDSPIPRN